VEQRIHQMHGQAALSRHPFERPQGEVIHMVRVTKAAPLSCKHAAIDAAVIGNAHEDGSIGRKHARRVPQQRFRFRLVFEERAQEHSGKAFVWKARDAFDGGSV
jgi:hypothetical protein